MDSLSPETGTLKTYTIAEYAELVRSAVEASALKPHTVAEYAELMRRLMEPNTLKPYTVAEYAELARLSRNAVYLMIARKELPAVRLGRAIRIPREAGDKRLTGEPA